MMEMKTVVRRERAKNKSEGRNIDEDRRSEKVEKNAGRAVHVYILIQTHTINVSEPTSATSKET